MTKRKKLLILRKNALKRILKNHGVEDMPSIILKDNRILQTNDYTKENLLKPVDVISNHEATEHLEAQYSFPYSLPCWDWFRMTNAKRDRMYYVDFSFPYTYLNTNEVSAIEFSYDVFPITKGEKLFDATTEIEIKRKEFMKQVKHNYDFTRNLEEMKAEIERRKANTELLVSISRDIDSGLFDGYSIVAPCNFVNYSIVEIFNMALDKINSGKLDSERLTESFISEIKPVFYKENLK